VNRNRHCFNSSTQAELQSVMFLQIVLGGHFLLYNTRTARWFFLPPFPSLPLNAALWATNILAILMCAYGWLVPKLSWTTIGWVLAYTLVWVFLMDIIKRATYALADHKTGWQAKQRRTINQPLGASDTKVPAAGAEAASS
jgi:H+-transporting ATPase